MEDNANIRDVKIINSSLIRKELGIKIPTLSVCENEPMAKHTSFKIGGNAELFLLPETTEQIVQAVAFFKQKGIPVFVIGNGSNLLVSDQGISGAVICLGKNFSKITCSGDSITACAGALLSKIANVAMEYSLTGLEFASGIPGSLGGAVMMNAGAYGGEMKDVLYSAEFLDADCNLKSVVFDAESFGYRKSIFKNGEIVLSAKLLLQNGKNEEIRAKMQELNEKRRLKQPLEYPSAGSTFKRPEGYFAAKLIDDAGLRGYKSGGAMVSEKHCGFVINYNNATYVDVCAVMEHVQNEVLRQFGVQLEPEVRIL